MRFCGHEQTYTIFERAYREEFVASLSSLDQVSIRVGRFLHFFIVSIIYTPLLHA